MEAFLDMYSSYDYYTITTTHILILVSPKKLNLKIA